MAQASGTDVEIVRSVVPVLPGVEELAADGMIPGGSRRNLAWAGEVLAPHDLTDAELIVLADAQTSGGLLFGAEPSLAEVAVATLTASGHAAAVVGRATSGAGTITLRR